MFFFATNIRNAHSLIIDNRLRISTIIPINILATDDFSRCDFFLTEHYWNVKKQCGHTYTMTQSPLQAHARTPSGQHPLIHLHTCKFVKCTAVHRCLCVTIWMCQYYRFNRVSCYSVKNYRILSYLAGCLLALFRCNHFSLTLTATQKKTCQMFLFWDFFVQLSEDDTICILSIIIASNVGKAIDLLIQVLCKRVYNAIQADVFFVFLHYSHSFVRPDQVNSAWLLYKCSNSILPLICILWEANPRHILLLSSKTHR